MFIPNDARIFASIFFSTNILETAPASANNHERKHFPLLQCNWGDRLYSYISVFIIIGWYNIWGYRLQSMKIKQGVTLTKYITYVTHTSEQWSVFRERLITTEHVINATNAL